MTSTSDYTTLSNYIKHLAKPDNGLNTHKIIVRDKEMTFIKL